MRSLNKMIFSFILLTSAASLQAHATNGSNKYSGGTFSTGTATGESITLTSATITGKADTLSFSCPITSYSSGTYSINWTCSGGTLSVVSADHSLSFTGSFTSGTMTFSGSGGGRGGKVVDNYQFTGFFEGKVTAAGVSQYAYGSVSQLVQTSSQLGGASAPVSSGSFGWNSGYSPVMAADFADGILLAADNVAGSNLVTTATAGAGVGTLSGLAEDALFRIYATDSTNDQILRSDFRTGVTKFGGPGAGVHQFSYPRGITIDSAGKIWVADAGNNRIVRFDDMTGAKWVSFGSSGAGINQFNSPASIAIDPAGRIYVADTGNNRLIRFDDLSGKNWTVLTQVATPAATYLMTSLCCVATDPAGHVYVGLASGYVLGMTDISGAGASASNWAGAITALSVDSAGTLYVGGDFAPGYAQAVDAAGTGAFFPGLGSTRLPLTALLALATPQPPPASSDLSSHSLAFGSESVGVRSPSQTVTLINLGAKPLSISPIASPPGYQVSGNCPRSLGGGASCAVNVVFQPITSGVNNATLTISNGGSHSIETVALSGTGVAR